MILFICNTPFQIMNAINIKMNEHQFEETDMYITDCSKQNYSIYIRLKDLDIFNKIYFIKYKEIEESLGNNKAKNYLKRLINIINNKRCYKQMLGNINNIFIYHKIYAELPDHKLQIIYKYQSKHNPDVEVYLYEDGTASYNFFDTIYSRTFLKRLMHKIIFGTKLDKRLAGFYVYKPEYISNETSVPIKKINPIDKNNSELKSLFNTIFEFKDDYVTLFKKRYIYFDQPWRQIEINEKCSEILNILLSRINNHELIIKSHPRADEQNKIVDYEVISTPISFEIIELNSQIDNKVLISIFSTACLNPKLIFNEEPYVILLFKLIDFSEISHFTENTFDIVYRVRDSYRNLNKFFIPNTIEELEQILLKISTQKLI